MNSDIIRLLPDSVANQIAAGEVIQRPASVIKELVENSIDAGATRVEIIIKDAGRTLIQVVDNGRGMSPTDARMAFERHATSKISSAADLADLHTMGFRGEALPSIAAVAQVELRTMLHGESIGTRLVLSDSQYVEQEPCACAPGTNLMVKNLFYHLPARRKYLKKDAIEFSHIVHEFERMALVNTNVEFTLVHNGVTLHKLLPGSLKQRITSLMGKALGGQLIPVSTETGIVKISGFVGLPQNARRRGAPQFLFVNGRNMRHPYFNKAITACYADLISPDMSPSFFVNLEVDPTTIDVNVHPQKHEIKFEHEQPIWQILNAAVRQALGRINAAGGIDFDADEMPEVPVFMPDRDAPMPSIQTDAGYNPFEQQIDDGEEPPRQREVTSRSIGAAHHAPGVPRDWDKLYEAFATRRDAAAVTGAPVVEVPAGSDRPAFVEMPAPPAAPSLLDDAHAETGPLLTVGRKYIVASTPSGLMLIDRYRAHVRILYDRFMASASSHSVASQQLLFPETVSLEPSLSAVMSAITDVLVTLGFDISFLGDNTWAINAAPAVKGNPAETLTRIVSDVAESGELSADAIVRPAALSLARAAAIMPGRELSDTETRALVDDLMASSDAAYTPDGLRTSTILTPDAINKLLV